ncbi:9246_t:CDS:2, partial [Paraglomus brasilianum]
DVRNVSMLKMKKQEKGRKLSPEDVRNVSMLKMKRQEKKKISNQAKKFWEQKGGECQKDVNNYFSTVCKNQWNKEKLVQYLETLYPKNKEVFAKDRLHNLIKHADVIINEEHSFKAFISTQNISDASTQRQQEELELLENNTQQELLANNTQQELLANNTQQQQEELELLENNTQQELLANNTQRQQELNLLLAKIPVFIKNGLNRLFPRTNSDIYELLLAEKLHEYDVDNLRLYANSERAWDTNDAICFNESLWYLRSALLIYYQKPTLKNEWDLKSSKDDWNDKQNQKIANEFERLYKQGEDKNISFNVNRYYSNDAVETSKPIRSCWNSLYNFYINKSWEKQSSTWEKSRNTRQDKLYRCINRINIFVTAFDHTVVKSYRVTLDGRLDSCELKVEDFMREDESDNIDNAMRECLVFIKSFVKFCQN